MKEREQIELIQSYGVFKNAGSLMKVVNLKKEIAFKNAIYDLGQKWFDWIPSTCSSCVFDVYIRILLKIKDMGKGKKSVVVEEPKNSEIEENIVEVADAPTELLYELKAGAILYDNDSTKVCTKHNLSNELAEYHINKNPEIIVKFSKYPK